MVEDPLESMDEDVEDRRETGETGFAKPSHEIERQLSTDANEPIAGEKERGGIFLSFSTLFPLLSRLLFSPPLSCLICQREGIIYEVRSYFQTNRPTVLSRFVSLRRKKTFDYQRTKVIVLTFRTSS